MDQSNGSMTHFIKQIVYGVELVLSMQRAIVHKEKKKNVEELIYFEAKSYFARVIHEGKFITEISSVEIPSELHSVSCTIYDNSLMVLEKKSFKELIDTIIDYQKMSENWKEKRKPMKIVVSKIPNQISARIYKENTYELDLYYEQNRIILEKIKGDVETLHIHTFLERISPLEGSHVKSFLNLLATLGERLDKDKNEMYTREKGVDLREKQKLLIETRDLVIKICKEYPSVSLLLDDTNLPIKRLNTIEANTSEESGPFILHVDYESANRVITKIQRIAIGKKKECLSKSIQLPIFMIASEGKEKLTSTKTDLQTFQNKVGTKYQVKNVKCDSFYIGLVPSQGNNVRNEVNR